MAQSPFMQKTSDINVLETRVLPSPAELLVAGDVDPERVRVTLLAMAQIAHHTHRVIARLGRQRRRGENGIQARFRGNEIPGLNLGPRARHQRDRMSRHEQERLFCQPPAFLLVAQPGRQGCQARNGFCGIGLAGFERRGPFVAASGSVQFAPCFAGPAMIEMRRRKVGVQRERRLESLRRLDRPMDAGQCQPERVQYRHVFRSQRVRALEIR